MFLILRVIHLVRTEKFPKKQHQGVRNVSFSENFAYVLITIKSYNYDHDINETPIPNHLMYGDRILSQKSKCSYEDQEH